ncbi:TetR/AcrR family transcriptional regulator [Rhizobium sp. BR 315]|uniref:TetR/AcrR family transcriptional regulator n=1 Tax=Rhizobium sp. BR 315 TaxID=3040014 RepID=UPI003D32E8E6
MELDPARRERILDAAAKLIVANGLQCSMAAIADAAGVATGSIYNYFKSKDDLIRGVYARLASTVAAHLIPSPSDPSGPRERIIRYIYDYIDFIWQDRQRALLFEYLSNVPLISGEELNAIFDEVTQYSVGLMSAAKAAGLLQDLPSSTMSGYIGGGIRNTLKWRRFNPAPLSDKERDEIALMSWNAIATLTERVTNSPLGD